MPKVVDKEEKRSLILKAAIQTFIKLGISNTRISDIANEAGIGKGTVYEYFKNRDELIIETIFAMNNSIGESVRSKITEETEPIDKINITIDVLIDSLKDLDNDVLGLSIQLNAEAMQNENLQKLCEAQCRKTFDEFHGFLIDTLNQGIKLNQFKPMNVDVVSRMIIALIDGAVYHSLALNQREKMGDWFHEYVETLINLIKIEVN